MRSEPRGLRWAVSLLVVWISVLTTPLSASATTRVVGYYAGWAIYDRNYEVAELQKMVSGE